MVLFVVFLMMAVLMAVRWYLYHGFKLLDFYLFGYTHELEGVNFSSPVLQVSEVQKRQRTFPSSLSKLGQENRN